MRCISSYSYIKPQLAEIKKVISTVVYLLIPTSNRNCNTFPDDGKRLYIFLFLHQTATSRCGCSAAYSCISPYSYIKPQLGLNQSEVSKSCISPYSYIKPQLITLCLIFINVVYLLIPTSNRNRVWQVYQTSSLYISLFLHQTATPSACHCCCCCCISPYSYIKPQLTLIVREPHMVVYLLIPTSNRN